MFINKNKQQETSSQLIKKRLPNTPAVISHQVIVLENILFCLKITCLIVLKNHCISIEAKTTFDAPVMSQIDSHQAKKQATAPPSVRTPATE